MACGECGNLCLRVQEYLLEGDANDAPMAARLVRRGQRDAADLWSISRGGFTLNNSLEWEYEPNPSSREIDYMRRNRYASEEMALRYWHRYVKKLNAAARRRTVNNPKPNNQSKPTETDLTSEP